MSRFLTAAATMQTLSLTAMEEASRDGRREADIEHMLLALILSEQSAGQVLRAMGITLDDARAAVREQHARQLSELGVTADHPSENRIVFHETEGYEWSERALRILNRATERRNGSGDATAVLRELLDEPSGLIEEILARLGIRADEVRARLVDAEGIPHHPTTAAGGMRGTFTAFIPAPVDEVWRLLSDGDRMPEWEPSIGAVQSTDDRGVWEARVRTERPDGKPIRVKPAYRRRRIELVEALEPVRIVWRIQLPDAPHANTHSLTVDLAPAAGGTQVTLTSTWMRRAGWRRIVGFPLRPLQRFLIWLALFQVAGGISRAFR
jgi:uncharacterized protein YndB with AHSA1/START domain